jgi:hypothetical protein
MFAVGEIVSIPHQGGQRVAVRRAGPADLFCLCDWADCYLQGDYFFRRNHLAGLLKRDSSEVFAILVDDQMAGMMIIYRGSVLHNLYLAPQFRKGGVGGSILEFFKPAVIRSKTNMLAGDPTSFYKKNGYAPVVADANRPHIIEMRRMTPFGPRSEAFGPPAAEPPIVLPMMPDSGGVPVQVAVVAPQVAVAPLPTHLVVSGDLLRQFLKFCQWQAVSRKKQELKREQKRQAAAAAAALHLPGGVALSADRPNFAALPAGSNFSSLDQLMGALAVLPAAPPPVVAQQPLPTVANAPRFEQLPDGTYRQVS